VSDVSQGGGPVKTRNLWRRFRGLPPRVQSAAAISAACLVVMSAGCASASTSEAPPAAASATTAPATSPEAAPIQLKGGTAESPTAVKQTPFSVNGGMTVVHFKMSSPGSTLMTVAVYGSSGIELIGSIGERGPIDASFGGHLPHGSYNLQVVGATGPWTTTITQPRPTSGAPLPTTYSGANGQPTIVGPFQTSPGQGVEAKHTNAKVTILDASGKAMAYTFGSSFNGTAHAPPSKSNTIWYLRLDPDRPWSVELTAAR
jgi:hypothetical protein